jgi:predicted MFS family arabinose efflux permease
VRSKAPAPSSAGEPGTVVEVDSFRAGNELTSRRTSPLADYSPRYVRTVIALLVAAVALEFLHRQLLAIAVEPIRRELGLSDGQMGWLVTAFALAYSAAILVLGRIADRTDRRNLYALGIVVWSVGTALGGAALGFASFVATRVVVGIGQAAAGATNAPLVADYVPPARRATTMGLVAMGATVGVFFGLFLGAWGIGAVGWRTTFAVLGGLGLLFAAFFRSQVHEPPRGWAEGRAGEAGELPRLADAIATIARLRTFRHMAAGAILASMAIFAGAQWGPAFFERVHGLTNMQAGLAAGGIGLIATLGAVAGGLLTDRLWARDARGALLLPAACCALACPATLAAYSSPTLAPAIALLALGMVAALVHAPAVGAVTQALAPLRVRGQLSAVLNSLLTLFGLGLGPLLAGLVSDATGGGPGSGKGLETGLAWSTALYAWSAVHFALAARTLPSELRSTSP